MSMINGALLNIILIIATYLSVVFLIPLVILPNFLVYNTPIMITGKISKVAKRLKSDDSEKTLNKVFDYVINLYSNERYKLFFLPYKHFYYDVDKLVDKRQFLPCHVQSLVIKTLLLASGQFTEESFEKKIVMERHGGIHEYYLVRIGEKTFKVDPFIRLCTEMID